MGFRINTNVVALKTMRNLQRSSGSLNQALERLASGSRINKAGDDAAGLAVSEGLRSQVRGLNQAVRNANDGVGFLQTAEGALAESTNIAQRIRELAIQAANGAIGDTDRTNLNNEVTALIAEFDRIATSTDYNGVNLLDGTFSTQDLQVGTKKGQTISFSIGNAKASGLGNLAIKSGVQNSIWNATTNLVINGVSFGSSVSTDDKLSYAGNSYSAIAIAKQINGKSGQTKVEADIQSAIVKPVAAQFSNFSGSLAGDTFKINGVQVVGTGITNVNTFIEAVNNVSSLSGVKARLQSGSTTLIDFYTVDGRNINLSISGSSVGASASQSLWAVFAFTNANLSSMAPYTQATSAGTALGGYFGFTQMLYSVQLSDNNTSTGLLISNLTAAIADRSLTFTGAIRLRSANAITISSGSDISGALGLSGITVSAGLTLAVDTSQSMANVAVDTQGRASDALIVVDAALQQMTNLRARLGAVQNRLQSNMNSLSVTSENLSAAQSQIRDADIAVETAELTKAQILQQAGVAVLGQANVSAQAALSLLKF